MNLLLVLFIFAEADLIAFNQNTNNVYRNLISEKFYHNKRIIPVTDVKQMKLVWKLLRHKNYKKAASAMKKLEFSHLLNNSEAKTERLGNFLASSKRN